VEVLVMAPAVPETPVGVKVIRPGVLRNFRRISGRNQLIGRVVDIKISGLMAQVTLSLGDQHITSIVTADAVRELRLKKGQIAAALIKSTEVMIVLP
jgi:molybdopterin-binding protein